MTTKIPAKDLAGKTVYLRHESGATHAFGGKKLAKLLKELQEGRGGPEVLALQEAGYTETLGGWDISGATFENWYAEACGNFSEVK